MNTKNIVLTLEKENILASLYYEKTLSDQWAVEFNSSYNPLVLAQKLYKKIDTQFNINYVMCPGGVFKPVKKGIYAISSEVKEAAASEFYGSNPYNSLTCVCYELAELIKANAIMYYPLSCDELLTMNRVSSIATIPKRSRYHACELAVMAEEYVKKSWTRVDETNLIAVWLDDQVSVAAFCKGRCIEVNDMIGGEGPMGLISSGDVPVAQLAGLRLDPSQKNAKGFDKILMNQSGILAYTGTSNPDELDRRARMSDQQVTLALESMAYQTAKWIGICNLAVQGTASAVIISGKAVQCSYLMEKIKTYIEAIAPISVFEKLDLSGHLAEVACHAGSFIHPIYEY